VRWPTGVDEVPASVSPKGGAIRMPRASVLMRLLVASATLLGLGSLVTVQPAAARSRHGASEVVLPKAKKANWTTSIAPFPRSLPDRLPVQQAILNSMSCSSSSFCVAVGAVVDTDINAFPLIETYSGSLWSATVAPLPANAVISAKSSFGEPLTSVSCPADGACAAVGEYDLTVGGQVPLLETLSHGDEVPGF